MQTVQQEHHAGAPLSLRNRVTAEPSLAEQAKRLELFELAKLRERIAELEERLESTEEQLKSDREAWNYAEAQLEKQLQELKAVNQEYQDSVGRLATSEDLLQRDLDNAQRMNRELEAEVKQLRELDPAGTRKRLDRVKKESAERQAAVAELRKKNKQLAKDHRQLLASNIQLNAALDKAIEDINAAQKLEPLRTIDLPRLGHWELYSCEHEGAYQVLDLENETSRTVRVDAAGELNVPKLRPVPKAIASWVVGVHQEYFGGANNG